MRISNLTLLVVMMLPLNLFAATSWHSGGQQIPVIIDSSKVLIKLDSTYGDTILLPVQRISSILDSISTIHGFTACSLSTGQNYMAFLDSLDTLSGIYLVEPYYMIDDSIPQTVGLDICVKFKPEVTVGEIDSIVTMYNVTLGDPIIGQPNAFVIANTDSSGLRVMDLANAFFDLPETEYSHPDYIAVISNDGPYMLYDFYHQFQWHIKKVIGEFNNSSVWDFGGLKEPIKVAVVGEGILPHEDLPGARILPGRNFVDPVDAINIKEKGQGHEMSVASIIAASHTTDISGETDKTSGVISMDPYVQIVPVQITKWRDQDDFDDFIPEVTFAGIADAIGWAYDTADVDIISASWSFVSPDQAETDVLTQAIAAALEFGRVRPVPGGGFTRKGCPVIFSAGNNGRPNGLNYPASLPTTFAVGAVRLDDSLWNYSNRGGAFGIDVVAPSGDLQGTGDVWTIDRMGAYGFNWTVGTSSDKEIFACPDEANDNLDYMCGFGGTSAAQPIVAGVAALLLSRNPDLWADHTFFPMNVYNIIRKSAQSNLDWGQITPPDVAYGYGRVDAFRAVLSIARGDVDADPNGIVDIADLTVLIDHLFISLAPLKPTKMVGNIDCDVNGAVDIADLTFLIDHLFISLVDLPIPCFNYVIP